MEGNRIVSFDVEVEKALTRKRLFNLKQEEYESQMDLAILTANGDTAVMDKVIQKLASLKKGIEAIEKMLSDREV